MKLQGKISLVLISSLFLSALLSIILVNIFVFVFDKSYSRYDLDKIASDVAAKIAALDTVTEDFVMQVFGEYEIYKDVFDLTFADMDRDFFVSTNIKDRMFKPKNFRREFVQEEERRAKELKRNFKFIDYFNTRDFVVNKVLVAPENKKGVVMVSVKKEYLFPFYIRVNNEKLPFIYITFFVITFVIIIISYILALLFTFPIIKRLKNLYQRINSFELTKELNLIEDHHHDEIGDISMTFNKMALKITENYNDMKKFYQDRQELLKNISHDFRTPLTSILGYAVSLDEGVYEDESEQKEYFKIIRKKAEYMSSLFDEMMELTRLDNNTYVLRKTIFDLAELLRSIIIEYLPIFEREEFYIDNELPEKCMINGDRERFSRAIRNIVENVLRHAGMGKYIGFALKKQGDMIILKISDRGEGIPDPVKSKIFDRFYRNSAKGGMGLGLTITKDIIEKHGGSITVQTNEHGGTVFVIEVKE